MGLGRFATLRWAPSSLNGARAGSCERRARLPAGSTRHEVMAVPWSLERDECVVPK